MAVLRLRLDPSLKLTRVLEMRRLLVSCLILGFSLISSTAEAKEDAMIERLREDMRLRVEIFEAVESFSNEMLYLTGNEQFNTYSVSSKRKILTWASRWVPMIRASCYNNSPQVTLMELSISFRWINHTLKTLAADEQNQRYGESYAALLAVFNRTDIYFSQILKTNLGEEGLQAFHRDLDAWIAQNPDRMLMHFNAATQLAGSYLDTDDAGILGEQRLINDLLQAHGGNLFTGNLESTLQSTAIQANRIELELERIADHIAWMPTYATWILQLMALDQIESGPINEALGQLEQLDELAALRQEISKLSILDSELAALSTSIRSLADNYGQLYPQVASRLSEFDLVNERMAAYEQHLSKSAASLDTLASTVANRQFLILLALIAGASLGIAMVLAVVIVRIVLKPQE
ncbi:hypothetical protein Caka_1770 [Coraliomargarita akajimensis DSM 45221]|uniref:Uncharacterized protein n=2 Tax=Coraliomargarita TaxID=442430 RepID=D5EK40_CORAD|nr:hypothetical protein Caka_1770 [Coraliomargarita akajimensis DSM 45221]